MWFRIKCYKQSQNWRGEPWKSLKSYMTYVFILYIFCITTLMYDSVMHKLNKYLLNECMKWIKHRINCLCIWYVDKYFVKLKQSGDAFKMQIKIARKGFWKCYVFRQIQHRHLYLTLRSLRKGIQESAISKGSYGLSRKEKKILLIINCQLCLPLPMTDRI